MNRPGSAGEPASAGWRAALGKIDRRAAAGNPSPFAAALLVSHGHRDEAIEVLREFLEQDPDHAAALRQLVALFRQQSRSDEAVHYLRRLHGIEIAELELTDAARAEAGRFLLATEGLARAPAAVPGGYVRAMFDDYAERFDRRLTEELSYRGPQEIHSIVTEADDGAAADLSILDAGCGTGLAAPLFRPLARRLDGIDLSPEMIERARRRELYDRLDVGAIVPLLGERNGAYDLIVLVDVLIYVGDLGPLLDACRAALAPFGRMALTVETTSGSDFLLHAKRRYAHSPEYVDRVAGSAGLFPLRSREVALRTESGKPVACRVELFRKP